ncbi:MAG: hypothetical protein HYW01_09035 [Deltaproteobacteria bacterium]|nr:hypothetical protein [Deltaproteobacteria bacterium]
MKELIKTLFNNASSYNKRRFFTHLIAMSLILVFVGASCTNSLDGRNSDDPIASIIGIFADIVFGNGSDVGVIQVSTEALPPGSTIEFNGNPICLFNEDIVLDNNGEAFANFLGPIFILDGATLRAALESEDGLLSVAIAEPIAVEITTSEGLVQKKTGSATVRPTGIIPPEEVEDVTFDPMAPPVPVAFTFQAVGVAAGMDVEVEVLNGLGTVETTPVLGNGTFVVNFTPSGAGDAILCVSIILANPSDTNSQCPNVPEEARTAEECILIPITEPAPTPSPTPGP